MLFGSGVWKYSQLKPFLRLVNVQYQIEMEVNGHPAS